jgi:hypothetical protein
MLLGSELVEMLSSRCRRSSPTSTSSLPNEITPPRTSNKYSCSLTTSRHTRPSALKRQSMANHTLAQVNRVSSWFSSTRVEATYLELNEQRLFERLSLHAAANANAIKSCARVRTVYGVRKIAFTDALRSAADGAGPMLVPIDLRWAARRPRFDAQRSLAWSITCPCQLVD